MKFLLLKMIRFILKIVDACRFMYAKLYSI